MKPPYLNVVSAMVGAARVAKPSVHAKVIFFRFVIVFPLFGLLLCFLKKLLLHNQYYGEERDLGINP